LDVDISVAPTSYRCVFPYCFGWSSKAYKFFVSATKTRTFSDDYSGYAERNEYCCNVTESRTAGYIGYTNSNYYLQCARAHPTRRYRFALHFGGILPPRNVSTCTRHLTHFIVVFFRKRRWQPKLPGGASTIMVIAMMFVEIEL
jgi:hypothetical protein